MDMEKLRTKTQLRLLILIFTALTNSSFAADNDAGAASAIEVAESAFPGSYFSIDGTTFVGSGPLTLQLGIGLAGLHLRTLNIAALRRADQELVSDQLRELKRRTDARLIADYFDRIAKDPDLTAEKINDDFVQAGEIRSAATRYLSLEGQGRASESDLKNAVDRLRDKLITAVEVSPETLADKLIARVTGSSTPELAGLIQSLDETQLAELKASVVEQIRAGDLKAFNEAFPGWLKRNETFPKLEQEIRAENLNRIRNTLSVTLDDDAVMRFIADPKKARPSRIMRSMRILNTMIWIDSAYGIYQIATERDDYGAANIPRAVLGTVGIIKSSPPANGQSAVPTARNGAATNRGD